MDVGLSDLLTCPRCGPTYGLVLLPYEAADRRVRTGVLGCANCRERWPIEAGVADLRVEAAPTTGSAPAPDREPEPAPELGPEDEAASSDSTSPSVRLAGLMGLAEARGTVLVAGPSVAHAAALSALVEEVEVVAVPEPGGPVEADPGVSPVRVTRVLPFRSSSLRGVALTGARTALLEEGARVLGREGRLVVDPAPADARARLATAGLTVVAETGGVVVAARAT